MEEKVLESKMHKLILDNRNFLQATGVKDVVSFDINEVLLETALGMLTLTGSEMHVKRLTLEKGEVDIEGRIDCIKYSQMDSYNKPGESLFKRLLK